MNMNGIRNMKNKKKKYVKDTFKNKTNNERGN